MTKRGAVRSAWRYSRLPARLMVALLVADAGALTITAADHGSRIVMAYLLPALALATVALVGGGARRAVRARRYGCW